MDTVAKKKALQAFGLLGLALIMLTVAGLVVVSTVSIVAGSCSEAGYTGFRQCASNTWAERANRCMKEHGAEFTATGGLTQWGWKSRAQQCLNKYPSKM